MFTSFHDPSFPRCSVWGSEIIVDTPNPEKANQEMPRQWGGWGEGGDKEKRR